MSERDLIVFAIGIAPGCIIMPLGRWVKRKDDERVVLPFGAARKTWRLRRQAAAGSRPD
jgi:hypothetical protein